MKKVAPNLFPETWVRGCGVTQPVTCLPGRHENPSLDLQCTCKNQA